MRCRTIKGGSKHAVTQCKSCGFYGRKGYYAIAKKDWPSGIHTVEQLPPFDEDALRVASAGMDREGRRHLISAEMPRVIENQLKAAQADLARRDQARADRAPYYVSDEWSAKRQLIFKRSNGMCEGCGVAKAVQVHHMSYENFGNEFLWELQAVCEPCHHRYHEPQATRDEQVRRGELPYEGPVGPLLTRIVDGIEVEDEGEE